MQEQRRFSRSVIAAMAEINHPSLGKLELRVKDFSDGGVYLLTSNPGLFPVGTELELSIRRVTGQVNIGPAMMKVVRQHGDGMGLMFL